jgi:hypothetical protein
MAMVPTMAMAMSMIAATDAPVNKLITYRLSVAIFLAAFLAMGAMVNVATFASSTNRLVVQLGGGIAVVSSPATLDQVKAALQIAPLDQRLANAALVRTFAAHSPDQRAASASAVASLGWWHTAALQNLLAIALDGQDVQRTLAVSDGLLRRQQLFTEASSVMQIAARDPELREEIVGKLQNQASWRRDYLLAASNITDRTNALAHYALLRSLESRGSAIRRDEVAAFLPALVRQGEPDLALDLWHRRNTGLTRPITDGRFFTLAKSVVGDASIPFEWTLLSGSGYFVDVVPRDQGSASVQIDWDGRGVPKFLSQLTSAEEGRRYRLSIVSEAATIPLGQGITARLICDMRNETLLTHRIATATMIQFETPSALPCSFPLLQIEGEPQRRPQPMTVTLLSITMSAL